MERKNRLYSWIRTIFVWIITAVIVLPIKHYVIAILLVKNTSMYPTIDDGEFVIVDRTRRLTMDEYEIGDIIMFEAPSDIKTTEEMYFEDAVATYDYEPEGVINRIIYYGLEVNKISYLKRIVAVGGDTVEFKNHKVYVNGEELVEDYLPEGTNTEPRDFNCITVPEGSVYVLGENREKSLDSRYLGCIPIEKIEGKVLFK